MTGTKTSTYHTQGNNRAKQDNRVTADVLLKYCEGNPKKMDVMLPELRI